MGWKRWIVALLLCVIQAAHAKTENPSQPDGKNSYYVSTTGSDSNDGLRRETPFATLQKGIDALAAGDSLWIAPGDYAGGIYRKDLGNLEQETLISAEVPGTVVIRGDTAAPEFTKAEGYRFIYTATLPKPQAILEMDTLRILESCLSLAELEFTPGRFFYDEKSGKVFLSTSDLREPKTHYYRIINAPGSGLKLENPKRVKIRGLTAMGHYALGSMGHQWTTDYTWGILLHRPVQCEVVDCTFAFNAAGLGLVEGHSNVVKNCTAYANYSQFQPEAGGIIAIAGTQNVIRDCWAYLCSPRYGIRFYLSGEAGANLLENNLTWAANTDNKGGKGQELGLAKSCVALGTCNVTHVSHSIVARNDYCREMAKDNIVINSETVDFDRQFADPSNFDFRLQASSRFRGTGPGGTDRGPHPYQANVFYLRAGGNDENSGDSLEKAWKTLSHALRRLKPGDTLYLAGGTYEIPEATGPLRLDSVAIRGRGDEAIVIRGAVSFQTDAGISLERLHFLGPVSIKGGSGITVADCHFANGLRLERTLGARLEHNTLSFGTLDLRESSGVFLASNLFVESATPAVRVDSAESVAYSDYNAYPKSGPAWLIGSEPTSLTTLQGMNHERHAMETALQVPDGAAYFQSGQIPELLGCGLNGTAIGRYFCPRRTPVKIIGPFLHSVTDTTANFEWWLSQPAEVEIDWGETPDRRERKIISSENFSTFSLTGLSPGTHYDFRIVKVTPKKPSPGLPPATVRNFGEALRFSTAPATMAARTLHVGKDGDDRRDGLTPQTCWKTISHAADQARPGDTVLIGEGTYHETIRPRATGAPEAPITFTAMPGAQVWIDGGAGRQLGEAFHLSDKSYIVIDGLRFGSFSRRPILGVGVLTVHGGKGVTIRRCVVDGRAPGYQPNFLGAKGSAGLTLENCVLTAGYSGIQLYGCPDFRAENNVFLNPLISAVVLENTSSQKAFFFRNIFTDNLPVKEGVPLFSVSEPDSLVEGENCYYLRDPDGNRNVFGFSRKPEKSTSKSLTLGAYLALKKEEDRKSLLANPMFAGNAAHPKVADAWYTVEALVGNRSVKAEVAARIDWRDLFSTNPVLVERNIGLERAAFQTPEQN